MSVNAIEVRGVGKRYLLGQQAAAYDSLGEMLAGALSLRRHRGQREEMWALRDIDLTVKQGEAVGIIGSNGAGKSTLLKILSRITEPTVGVSRVRGRVGVMIEVGTGFHPDLSGRENVFLSGAVMGMRRKEIRRRYDDIVEFAGVERFLETPLKRYSSGMALRLAFAVAAHLEPELMLVDEILAVGDVEFQRRCLQRMNRLSSEGRTVVFVSHDLGAITRLCSRAIWAEKGRFVQEGVPADVVRDYYAALVGHGGEAQFEVEGDVGVSGVAVLNARGEIAAQPTRGEELTLQARLVAERAMPDVDLAVRLANREGTVVMNERWSDQPGMPTLVDAPGEHLVRLRVPPLLRPGDYVVSLWLGTEHEEYFQQEVLRFTLLPGTADSSESINRQRVVQPGVTWTHVGAPAGDG